MIKGYIKMIALMGLCVGFIYSVGPVFNNRPYVKPLVDFIEERDIDAGALYYTEIEEFSEANINMENTMDYMPGKAH